MAIRVQANVADMAALVASMCERCPAKDSTFCDDCDEFMFVDNPTDGVQRIYSDEPMFGKSNLRSGLVCD